MYSIYKYIIYFNIFENKHIIVYKDEKTQEIVSKTKCCFNQLNLMIGWANGWIFQQPFETSYLEPLHIFSMEPRKKTREEPYPRDPIPFWEW